MPATKHPIYTDSIEAAAAIAENQAVGWDGNVASAVGAMKGLATHDADAGEFMAIDRLGTSIAIAGGAIAEGAELEVGAGGKLVTKAAGITVARAEQAASADGDRIEVYLLPH